MIYLLQIFREFLAFLFRDHQKFKVLPISLLGCGTAESFSSYLLGDAQHVLDMTINFCVFLVMLHAIFLGVFIGAILSFIRGEWQIGLIMLAINFVIGTIGGLMMGPPRG